MPRKTTIKILNKCESSSQTRNTNLSCLKLNWKKRNNFVLEDEMQHIWYQTEKVVHYCFIRIWIEKSILVQLHIWVWNLVKKTSVNLSYTMQLRHATKHRTKYIKNILGQPVHTKELIYVQLVLLKQSKNCRIKFWFHEYFFGHTLQF